MKGLIFRIIVAWPQIVRRTLANWQLMSTVVVGVLLASSIMAGTIIYFDALRELALNNSLAQLSVNDTNILVKSDRGPTTYAEREKVVRETEREIQNRVSWMLRDGTTGVKSATFFLTVVGREARAGTDSPRTFFGNLPRLLDHATIAPGGRAPGDTPVNTSGGIPIIEALVPMENAQDLGVQVGDTLSAVPYWEDSAPYIHVVITGVFTPNDPDDELWHLNERVLKAATADTFRTLPFYITEKAYYETLGATFRQMDSVYGWLLMVDPGKLNANNSRFAHANIEAMEDRLSTNLFSYRQLTRLDEALFEYDLRLFFSKLPMFVILVLISVVILYYVITLSSLVVEQQRGEIVLLKSRGGKLGAGTLRVCAGGSDDSGPRHGPRAIPGGCDHQSARLYPRVFRPQRRRQAGNPHIPERLSDERVRRPAQLRSAHGTSVTSFGHEHDHVQTAVGKAVQPRPFYQRYYLDVLLLVIGMILLRQLSEQGSVVAVGIFGEIAVDQILLAVPAVILVASALALLRLFPLFMRISSALLSSFLSAGLVLGIWQMARNPTHYARLSLRLILMAGLGISPPALAEHSSAASRRGCCTLPARTFECVPSCPAARAKPADPGIVRGTAVRGGCKSCIQRLWDGPVQVVRRLLHDVRRGGRQNQGYGLVQDDFSDTSYGRYAGLAGYRRSPRKGCHTAGGGVPGHDVQARQAASHRYGRRAAARRERTLLHL